MPYKPDGSPPPRGRCPKDREGLLIIMKNKDLWRNIIQVVVSILTAALTALGTPTVKQEGEGCTGLQPSPFEKNKGKFCGVSKSK